MVFIFIFDDELIISSYLKFIIINSTNKKFQVRIIPQVLFQYQLYFQNMWYRIPNMWRLTDVVANRPIITYTYLQTEN